MLFSDCSVMEYSTASIAANSAGSAESVLSLSPLSIQYDDSISEVLSEEAGPSDRKEKKRNYTTAPGSINKIATLVPSRNDPDINALFQAIINQDDGQRYFQCRECGSAFTRPYSACRHAQVHLRTLNVTCGICYAKMSGPLSLAVHENAEHNGESKAIIISCKKETRRSSSSTTRRTSASSVANISPIREGSADSVVIIDSEPGSISTSELCGSSSTKPTKRKMDEGLEMRKDEGGGVAVLTSDKTDEADASKSSVSHERRSSRIKRRKEKEAIAVEEEKSRPRKVTPPPIYPSNIDKLKESREMSLRVHLSGPSTQKQKSEDHDAATSRRKKSMGSSRAGGVPRAPSSRPSSAAARRPPPTAAATSTCHDMSSPHGGISSPEDSMDSFSPMLLETTPSPKSCQPSSAGLVVGSTPARRANCNAHYPRLIGVYGTKVHRSQPFLCAPRDRLYPSPLSADLLLTIYNPAWTEEEKEGVQTRPLLLTASMHREEAMMEKCLKGLEETSMPLPPLQPLLPSPCALLDDGCSDPLSDVLDSLPPLPSDLTIFSSQPMHTGPRYTTACEAARHQVWSKSEDRKWWEMRTFPSYEGLLAPGPSLLPFAARPNTLHGYAIADKNFRKFQMAGKFTYVTSKKPMFSVLELKVQPPQQPQPLQRPYKYTTPPSICTTPSPSARNVCTPSTSSTGSYSLQYLQGSGPMISRRAVPPMERMPALPRPVPLLRAPPKRKRTAAGTPVGQPTSTAMAPTGNGGNYPHAPYPGMPNEQQLQPSQPVPQTMAYCTSATPSAPTSVDENGSGQLDGITMDTNGTTFTIL